MLHRNPIKLPGKPGVDNVLDGSDFFNAALSGKPPPENNVLMFIAPTTVINVWVHRIIESTINTLPRVHPSPLWGNTPANKPELVADENPDVHSSNPPPKSIWLELVFMTLNFPPPRPLALVRLLFQLSSDATTTTTVGGRTQCGLPSAGRHGFSTPQHRFNELIQYLNRVLFFLFYFSNRNDTELLSWTEKKETKRNGWFWPSAKVNLEKRAMEGFFPPWSW